MQRIRLYNDVGGFMKRNVYPVPHDAEVFQQDWSEMILDQQANRGSRFSVLEAGTGRRPLRDDAAEALTGEDLTG